MTTVQEVRDEIMGAFSAFRDSNDQRLAEIERNGQASGETRAAVERANADIERLQNELDELTSAAARLDEIETRLNRPGAGGRGAQLSDERVERYAAWESTVKGQKVDPAHVDFDAIAAYNRAFDDYARHGAMASLESMRVLNEMSVGSNPDGGYWVDPDTSGRLASFLHETSPIRGLASVQVVDGDALEGNVELGEAGFGWVGEQEERGETGTPQIHEWRIPLTEMYAQPYATQRLLDMTRMDVGAWLEGSVRRRFGRGEASAFVAGDGVKRPRGFLTYPAGVPGETTATWPRIEQVNSGNASSLTSDGILDLVYAMKDEYHDGAVLGFSRTTEREVRQLKDGQGNYLWQPDFQQGPVARLVGFPVVAMADMPDIAANALAIVFANFGEAYQIVDRGGIRVLRDPYTTKGKVKFYTTRYVGGGIRNFEAIKLQIIAA